MKIFILKSAVFVVLLGAIIALGLMIPDELTLQDMHYSMIDKLRLLKEATSPRLILIGGSNVAFGIDSKKLQYDLHVNVINAGIHAGYGFKFMFDYLIPNIKNGDTVVLIPEYELFFDHNYLGEGSALAGAIKAVPFNFHYLSFGQKFCLLKFIPGYSAGKLKVFLLSILRLNKIPKEIKPYARLAFNEYGDIVAHWGKPVIAFKSKRLDVKSLNKEAFQVLNDCRRAVEKKGGRLFIAYPCLNNGTFKLSIDKIRVVQRELEKNDFEVLGEPEEYSLPDNMYFDGRYHPSKKGVDKNTGNLLEYLKRVVHPPLPGSGN